MAQTPSDSCLEIVARPAGDDATSPTAAITRHDMDGLILALAARQHGVVARWQLRRAKVPSHRIEYQLKRGWFESIHRGVYRVGPLAPPCQHEMAAILATGDDAVLSHSSAAALWKLLPSPAGSAPITVSTTRDLRGRSSGIRVHRVTALPSDEITRLGNLPLTTPSRTLLDLAGSLTTRELEQAIARADRAKLLDRNQLEQLLIRYPHRRDKAGLRALLTAPESPALTRSEAEERFLTLVRKARFRTPKLNVRVRGFEVDALWEAERLIVEIDGFAFHSSPAAFEKDRHRDGVLAAAGYLVIRVTWHQLTREREALVARLAQTLAARGSP